jgi:hypothetical protein
MRIIFPRESFVEFLFIVAKQWMFTILYFTVYEMYTKNIFI